MTLRFSVSLLLFALLLTGCAQDDGAPNETAEAAASEEAMEPGGNAGAARLTPEYLAGAWCYRYYEAAGEREEENITYEFREDGSLVYQTTPHSDVDQPGSYTLTTDGTPRLRIQPTLMVLPHDVLEVSENTFTLGSATTQLVFERGACP